MRRGKWVVERFRVTARDEQRGRIRASFGHPREAVPRGVYRRLIHDDRGVVMSDTPAEIEDLSEMLRRAQGGRTALCHGLGLGVAVRMLADLGLTVDAVEIDPDVIALVGPGLKKRYGDRVQIVCGDALSWSPQRGARWDIVWHDIWDAITPDNLPEMRALCRRFGRRSGWQGCWGR